MAGYPRTAYVVPAGERTAVLDGAPIGRDAGRITMQLLDDADAVAVADAAAITAGPGTYLRTYTAPAGEGTYRETWTDLDAPGVEIPATELVVTSSPPSTAADIRPTPDEVAALLHSRTVDGGGETGTFDNDSVPTRNEVQALITMAVSDLLATTGQLPVEFVAEARRLVTYQSATLIEASYGEPDSDNSAVRQYQAMYLRGLESLSTQLAALL